MISIVSSVHVDFRRKGEKVPESRSLGKDWKGVIDIFLENEFEILAIHKLLPVGDDSKLLDQYVSENFPEFNEKYTDDQLFYAGVDGFLSYMKQQYNKSAATLFSIGF